MSRDDIDVSFEEKQNFDVLILISVRSAVHALLIVLRIRNPMAQEIYREIHR